MYSEIIDDKRWDHDFAPSPERLRAACSDTNAG
jgi:hypothetical protein